MLIIAVIFNIFAMIFSPFNTASAIMETFFIEIISIFSLLTCFFYALIEENTSNGETRLLFGIFV